jgi:hypothetical protein
VAQHRLVAGEGVPGGLRDVGDAPIATDVQAFAAPDQAAVVGRHGDVLPEAQALGLGEPVDGLEVAHAADRIARLEPGVEACVAFRGEGAVVVERAVEADDAARCQHPADAGEQALDRGPADDVYGVGVEDGVDRADRPVGVIDVEGDGRQDVGESGLVEPGLDAGVVDRQFAGAPGEVRQRRAEMDGVLAGAAGDLQDLAAVGEGVAQHGEDRLAVLFAGFGKGFHGVIPPESMVTVAAGALQQSGLFAMHTRLFRRVLRMRIAKERVCASGRVRP